MENEQKKEYCFVVRNVNASLKKNNYFYEKHGNILRVILRIVRRAKNFKIPQMI